MLNLKMWSNVGFPCPQERHEPIKVKFGENKKALNTFTLACQIFHHIGEDMRSKFGQIFVYSPHSAAMMERSMENLN